MFVQNDCLGLYKIEVCDTVQCDDGAHGTRQILFTKKIWTRQLTKQEQGGYQGFYKIHAKYCGNKEKA